MVYMKFEDMLLVLSVGDIADTLMIGRNKAYSLVDSGKIKALRIGNHYRIPRDSFLAFLKGELTSGPKSAQNREQQPHDLSS